MHESRLVDMKELVRIHPALGQRKYRLHWLVRTRRIPFTKIGRMIYFDLTEINRWIQQHRIPAQNGGLE